MKTLFNKTANKFNLSKELKNKSIALSYVNEILPIAKKASEQGLYKCEIKLNRKQRKYARYFRDILLRKGFEKYDIVVNEKSIILKWFN